MFIFLKTIGKIFVYVANALATVSFILLAGDAIWWLVFYKVKILLTFLIHCIVSSLYTIETRSNISYYTNRWPAGIVHRAYCYSVWT